MKYYKVFTDSDVMLDWVTDCIKDWGITKFHIEVFPNKKETKGKYYINVEPDAMWEIDGDGWYPYCTKCGAEPKFEDNIDGLPERCPICNSRMFNWKDFKKG